MPVMTPLQTAIAIAFFCSLLLALVFAFLYSQYRERHMRLWTWSWCCLSVRLCGDYLRQVENVPDLVDHLIQGSALLAGLFLLLGTAEFVGTRVSWVWLTVAVASLGWDVLVHLLPLPEEWARVPIFAFYAAMTIWTGWLLVRVGARAPWAQRMTGWLLILWGMHKLNYPFRWLSPDLAPFGFLLGAFFALAVAFSMLLAYFQNVRRQLGDGQALLQSVIDHNDNAVMALDAEFRVVFCNRRYREMWPIAEAFLAARPTIDALIREVCRLGLYPQDQADILVAHRMAQLQSACEATALETPRLDGMVVEGFATPLPRSGYLLSFRDVTRQVRDAEALRLGQEHFRTLVETVPHSIVECDMAGRIVFANQRFSDLCGESLASLLGREFWTLILQPASREAMQRKFSRAVQQQITPGRELVENIDTAGMPVWRQLDWNYLKDAGGALRGFIGVVTDVTAERQVELQLRQLFHVAPMAIITLDAGGEIRLWNQAAEKVFGWSEEAVKGESFAALLLGAAAAQDFAALLRGGMAGETARAELPAQRRGGGLLDMVVILGPLQGGGGQAEEVVLIVDDVTERKRIESALRNSEETYRALVEKNPAAVFVHVDGVFIYLNPAAVELFGAMHAQQLEGRQVADFIDPAQRAAFRAHVAALPSSAEQSSRMELIFHPLDGERREVEATFLDVNFSGCEARMALCLDVTARNRSELELRAQADFMQTVLDTIPAPIFYKDAAGIYLGCNRAFADFHGRRREELVGCSVFDVAPPDLAAIYAQADQTLLRQGGTQVYETEMESAAGRRHEVLFTKAVFRQKNGEVGGLVGTMLDISERKRAEELTMVVARGVSAETGAGFFRSLTRYLAQALTADYAIVGAIEGESVRVVAGVGHGTELEPFSYPLSTTPCANVVDGGAICTFAAGVAQRFPEDRLLRELQVEGYAGSPLLGNDGTPLGILVVLFTRPITEIAQVESLLRIFAARAAAELERRRAEQEQRASEVRFRQLSREFETIFNGIPDSLTVWGADLQLVWANQATASFYHRPVTELIGASCRDLCRYGCAVAEACEVHRCLQSGRGEELVRDTPDGHSWGIKTFPLRNEAGELVRVIRFASDISEKVRLREEAARASHLAALGELAAGVAHEINNPTGLILLDLPILRDAFADARPILDTHMRSQGNFPFGGRSYALLREQIPQMLDEVFDGAQRIKHIVEELKDFSLPADPHQFVAIDLNEVVRKAASLVGNQIRKATDDFAIDYAPEASMALGSFQRLEQVVINLLLNACQALPDRQCPIRVEIRREGEWAVVRVSDGGIGIRPELLAQITDPFFTTRREQGGTGLGLSVSSRIVEEHGGTIHFASTPGSGTCVTVTLPGG